MIRVNCRACGKRLKVPLEGAGRIVKCPRCLAGVSVPNIIPTVEPPPEQLDLNKEPVLGPLFEPEAPPPRPTMPPTPLVVEPLVLPATIPHSPAYQLPVAVVPLTPVLWSEETPHEEPESEPEPEPELTQEPDAFAPPPLPPLPADPGGGVRYVTEDPSWFGKLALGGFIISFPILESVCDGYQIQTIRNLRAGNKRPLPDWGDLGGLFMTGLPLRLAIYAMYIPTVVLSVFLVFVNIAWLARFFFDSDTKRDISILMTITNWVLIPLLNLFVVLLQSVLFLTVPLLARRVADGHSFLSLFDPRPTLRLISGNLTAYITARLTIFVLFLVFGMISAVVSGVGWVVVIGPLIGWMILGIARFWSRQIWAYHLARMRPPETGW